MKLEIVIFGIQTVILGIQAVTLFIQVWLFKRQNDIIKSGTDSQLLLEVYRSFFENPLYSAITKAIDRGDLLGRNPRFVHIFYNEKSHKYRLAVSPRHSRYEIHVGTLEDYLDDYLGWFDVLGILIQSGHLSDDKAKSLFGYYLEMALRTRVVSFYLERTCEDLTTFKTYWRGLYFLIQKWQLIDLLPEKFR